MLSLLHMTLNAIVVQQLAGAFADRRLPVPSVLKMNKGAYKMLKCSGIESRLQALKQQQKPQSSLATERAFVQNRLDLAGDKRRRQLQQAANAANSTGQSKRAASAAASAPTTVPLVRLPG